MAVKAAETPIFYKQPLFYLFWGVLIGLAIFAYKDHYNNPFQFDDHHTIQSNLAIRDMGNIPTFFTDATTTSSLPANQAYRPGLTTLNTIDYWLSDEKADPKPQQFHRSIFFSFILLSVFIFLFAYKIFTLSEFGKNSHYWALLVAAIFTLHTANAETINYVIARSDSFSTLMIMIALVLFSYMKSKKRFYWYLVPMALGFFVKEPAVMVGPLALLFVLLFEEQLSVADVKGKFSVVLGAFKKLIPAFILAVVLFAFAKAMTPKTWTSGGIDPWGYWLVQPFVMVHYVTNYFFPFNLSADTDWGLIKSPFDDRVIAGVIFVGLTLWLAYKASFYKHFRPVTYGILWFYICLSPTSLMPFAEVLNDHRVFLPYIGLTVAVVTVLRWLYLRFGQNSLVKFISAVALVAFFIAHVKGVRERCDVWSSGEKLWYDVTVKSPRNGRGLMNYGNAMMGLGKYDVALEYFNRAKQEWPGYAYIYTNLGVLQSAMGNQEEAERNFKQARSLNGQNPEFYLFYSTFLTKNKRYTEAKEMTSFGLSLSPQHIGLQNQLRDLQTNPLYAADEAQRIKMAEEQALNNRTPDNYLNLSLVYYQAKRYEDCIRAAEEALKLNPNYAFAYNNIFSAYNELKQWDKSIEAGKKGLAIDPNYQLLKNNLQVALDAKTKGI